MYIATRRAPLEAREAGFLVPYKFSYKFFDIEKIGLVVDKYTMVNGKVLKLYFLNFPVGFWIPIIFFQFEFKLF